MAVHDPVTVWYGGTQLTGSGPLAMRRVPLNDPRRENLTQKVFFDTVLTAPPKHVTPKRRYSSLYIPGRDGSYIAYDDGYADTTQAYEIALDMTPEEITEGTVRKLRAFEDALTGRTPGGHFDSSKARWDWLIDTYDNYFQTIFRVITLPRPRLHIVGTDYTAESPFADESFNHIWARLAMYDGGDDIANTLLRTGRATVTFKVKPELFCLYQDYAKDPTLYPGGHDSDTDRDYDAHYGLGPLAAALPRPIIRLYWDGNAKIQRTDSTQPMTIYCSNNIFKNGAGHISYDTDELAQADYGGYGIGWDMLTGRVITGDATKLADTDPYAMIEEGGQNFYIFIDNGVFVPGTGHMYISVEYATRSIVC